MLAAQYIRKLTYNSLDLRKAYNSKKTNKSCNFCKERVNLVSKINLPYFNFPGDSYYGFSKYHCNSHDNMYNPYTESNQGSDFSMGAGYVMVGQNTGRN